MARKVAVVEQQRKTRKRTGRKELDKTLK